MSLSDEIGAKSGTSSAYATLLKAKKAEFAALKKRRAALMKEQLVMKLLVSSEFAESPTDAAREFAAQSNVIRPKRAGSVTGLEFVLPVSLALTLAISANASAEVMPFSPS